MERISFELLELLTDKHFTLDDLIIALNTGNEKQRVESLRNLLYAGKLKTYGLKYYL